MGINPGKGTRNKNFAVEVLKIEISGPTRSHFSILDIPGIFSNDFNVRAGEMDGVRSMVIEYMKRPENIVMYVKSLRRATGWPCFRSADFVDSCVADAATDLALQDAFKLAGQHVDKTRLVGVFTKCDLLRKADPVRRNTPPSCL